VPAAAFGDDAVGAVRRRYFKKDLADDDIHDAIAALWTAERIVRGIPRRMPDPEGIDACGLRMAMWY
jgi:predicted RNase H-like nuclease